MKPHPILVAWIDALRAHNHPITAGALCRNGSYCALGLLADCDPEATHRSIKMMKGDPIEGFVWSRFHYDMDNSFIPKKRLSEVLNDTCESRKFTAKVRDLFMDNDSAWDDAKSKKLSPEDTQAHMRRVHEKIADKIVSLWMKHHGLTECPPELQPRPLTQNA